MVFISIATLRFGFSFHGSRFSPPLFSRFSSFSGFRRFHYFFFFMPCFSLLIFIDIFFQLFITPFSHCRRFDSHTLVYCRRHFTFFFAFSFRLFSLILLTFRFSPFRHCRFLHHFR